MFLYNHRYLISILLVIVCWKQIDKYLGIEKMSPVFKNFLMPVIIIILLSELIGYLSRLLMYRVEGMTGRLERQVSGYDPVGSGKNNVTTQEIANANYYGRMNMGIVQKMNPVIEEDDKDTVYTPDNAGLVENMDGTGGDVQQITQVDMNEATNKINVPQLASIVPANSDSDVANDYNNRLGCAIGKGKCTFLCSKPEPENPCNLVAPVPGGQWQVQNAMTVYDRLSKGNYVPSKCDITKMELIRRGDIPQSSQ